MKLSACGTSCSKGGVFQRVQTTIHSIAQLILLALVLWIVIYPVDSALYPLNNWGLITSEIIFSRFNK